MSQKIDDTKKFDLGPEIFELLNQVLNNSNGQKEIINKLPEVKSFSRSDVISKLKKYYKDQKLVLTLGAGISIDFGLPTWPVLLQRLMITTFEKEQNVSAVLSKFFTNLFNPSPLIAGRYLQKYFEEKKIIL